MKFTFTCGDDDKQAFTAQKILANFGAVAAVTFMPEVVVVGDVSGADKGLFMRAIEDNNAGQPVTAQLKYVMSH